MQSSQIKKVNNTIGGIIGNLNKRFPSMLQRIEWDDLSQEGWLLYLKAKKVYRTDTPCFRFVRYGLMIYQRPKMVDQTISLDLVDAWLQSRPVVDVFKMLRGLRLGLKRIVLKKLNGMPLSKKQYNTLYRGGIMELQKLWFPLLQEHFAQL